MNVEITLFQRWSVVNVHHIPEHGTFTFRVSPINFTTGSSHSVVRNRDDTWSCDCGKQGGTQVATVCDHILRARFYYKNMLERSEALKQQLKAKKVQDEERASTVFLTETKRKINLE
jgi:hypothetical protein